MACTMKDQIKCGDCGAETFTIFHEKKPRILAWAGRALEASRGTWCSSAKGVLED